MDFIDIKTEIETLKEVILKQSQEIQSLKKKLVQLEATIQVSSPDWVA